jgi:response regulator RpfG family c-di-GMP phosphodiesterase
MLFISKPLLVVTDAATKIPIPAKRNIVAVNNIHRIFPSIHELQPSGLILDHDMLGTEAENILRRLRANPFYKNIKIYCYKSRPHTKVDDLLRTLGVKQFIYAPEKPQTAPAAATTNLLDNLLDSVSVATNQLSTETGY